jgi:hypothetical protein
MNARGENEEEEEEEEAEEVEGQLERQDSIVAIEASNFAGGEGGGRRQTFLVEAIRIIRIRSSSLDNRKVTPLDMFAFEGKAPPRPSKPLPLAATGPNRPDIDAFEGNPTNMGLFGRTAFLVTYASSSRSSSTPSSTTTPNGDSGVFKEVRQGDKDRFIEKIKSHGAIVIDWEHLFEAKVTAGGGGSPEVSFARQAFADIDTILLLSDRPTTTVKYLIALALGIPCCSIEFAHATIKEVSLHLFVSSSALFRADSRSSSY